MPAPKSPYEMFQAMKRNIVEKTGESFDHWISLAKKSKLGKFKQLLDHMKQEHGLPHGYAQMIAWGVLDPARLEADNKDQSLVDDLYTGKKASLRPIYDKLMKTGLALEGGVDTVICKTYTSLRAKSQFAIFAPRTNSAVDVELALPATVASSSRLEPIKNSNPRFTHRIRISDPSEVDSEISDVLKAALDNNL